MLLFLDLETTGFEKETDNILEISAVRYDETKKEIVAKFDRILQLPEGAEVSPMIQGLTGISTEMCQQEGVSMSQAQQEFSEFIRDDDIITGHNISFDTGFLNQYGFLDKETHRHKEIDTFILSVLVLGQQEESHALEILSQKYGIVHKNAHRAMSDVLANLAFYRILEIIYAKNFSEKFQTFLKNHNFSFEEQYFFDAVSKKKEMLQQENLPEVSQKKTKTDPQDSSKEKFFTEKFEKNTSLFFESFNARKYISSLLQSAKNTGNNISLFYPKKQKEEFFAIFTSLQEKYPTLTFFGPREHSICEEKYATFLKKDNFDKQESIVATKVFRAKERGEDLFLRFMGEEWSSARKILGQKTVDLSTYPIKMLPFSESIHQNNEEEIRVFFGAEDLEYQLLELQQQKSYSKRLLEDFTAIDDKKEKISIILEELSSSLRAEKGENRYSIKTLWRDISKAEYFQKAKNELEEFEHIHKDSCSELEKEHIFNWTHFFNTPAENEVKILEIFPDNTLCIETIDPYFEESFQKICAQNDTTIFFGKSFPQEFSKKIQMSFPLQKEFTLLEDEKFFPSEVFCPEFSRDATPQEIATLIIQEWEKNADKNFIISLTSNKNISETKEFLRIRAEELGIKIFTRENGGRGKIKKLMQKFPQKIVIGNAKFLESLDLSPQDFSKIFIHKVQFDHPKQPLVQAQRKRFMNDFEEFSIPRASARLSQDIFQFSESPIGKTIQIFLGEGRIGDSSTFYSKFQNILPDGVVVKKWNEA